MKWRLWKLPEGASRFRPIKQNKLRGKMDDKSQFTQSASSFPVSLMIIFSPLAQTSETLLPQNAAQPLYVCLSFVCRNKEHFSFWRHKKKKTGLRRDLIRLLGHEITHSEKWDRHTCVSLLMSFLFSVYSLHVYNVKSKKKALSGWEQEEEAIEKDIDVSTFWFFSLKHFWFPPSPVLHPYGCVCAA